MFDGGEQFHEFIASSRTSLPIPTPSFPLHGNPSFPAAFDSYAPPLHHQKSVLTLMDPKQQHHLPISTSLALESDGSRDPWPNDELLALLKLRSSFEIWFPDFNWEHVSKKLGELGFKRSGEECKEKFEEETRHFNNIVIHNKNYRVLSELDEFYHVHDQHQHDQEEGRISGGRSRQDSDKADQADDQQKVEEDSRNVDAGAESERAGRKGVSSKRKRRERLEMLKGFCEEVVKTMMAKQEELHQKLIHDIVRRDEEKIAREEAWKSREMDRVRTEIEIRSKEQKSAAERQAIIIEFLKHFTSDQEQHLCKKTDHLVNINSNSNSNSSASFCEILPTHQHQDRRNQNPNPSLPSQTSPNPATKTKAPTNPSSILAAKEHGDHEMKTPPPEKGGGDVGKRWPRDEVLALINLRCQMSGNNACEGQEPCKEGSNSNSNTKGPLWERISQGMTEMGYKRNAKRCKEKWENINKYFRKTKDSSKKRSANSRTCPYFHQLSSLYSDGTIVAPNQTPENN